MVMGSDLIDTDIGGDTVTLVIRQPAPGFDANNQPNITEVTIDKGPLANPPTDGCAFLYAARATEEMDETGSVAVIRHASVRLPVDSDTSALAATDAIRQFGGTITFEMQGPAVIIGDIDGNPDHVFAELQCMYDTGHGEQITVTPYGGRDDDGNVSANGVPFNVVAFTVQAGNTVAKFGPGGELSEAAFTIVVPIDTPVQDDDWVTVRGKTGRARIQTQLTQYAGRQRLVVLVITAAGGEK